MVKEIIPGFPKSDQADLKKAAEEWRFPFWDWAMKKKDDKGVGNYDVPKVARLPEVEVRVPGGTSKIPNPFYQFVMPDGKAMGDEDLKPDIVTREPVRCLCRSL